MAAYEYSQRHEILFLGLSNGKLYQYKSKTMDKTSIFKKGKEPERTAIESPHSHKGSIRKMIYTRM